MAATPAGDSFLKLERHLAELEENVRKLTTALQHWRKLDAEYEELKEAVAAVIDEDGFPRVEAQREIARMRRDLSFDLISKKDLNEIFGRVDLKPPDQIVNILSRRVDYVTQNIEALTKQLEAAENKYAAATVISQPDVVDEQGLPVTDIMEELDEADNVVSYKLLTPGDAQPQVREALRSAGFDDFETSEEASEKVSTSQMKIPSKHDNTMAKGQTTTLPKKTVSFADDTKTSGDTPVPANAQRLNKIMETARSQEDLAKEEAVLPDDESEDEAALRRQMLIYGRDEIGAIVAELTLEEGESDEEDNDFDDFDENYVDDDEDEDEDDRGMSKESVLTPSYRQRMMEIERRLGVLSRFTQDLTEAPEEPEEISSDDEDVVREEGIGRIAVKADGAAVATTSAKAPSILSSATTNLKPEGKKSVSFAQSPDIAPTAAVPASGVLPAPGNATSEPHGDVVERTEPSKIQPLKTPRKASRFKTQRGEAGVDSSRDEFSSFAPPKEAKAAQPAQIPVAFRELDRPVAPSGPAGKVVAEEIVEREKASQPESMDEFDNTTLHQEVAEEFHRQRRKFIRREGGFKEDDDAAGDEVSYDDTSGEATHRVSRFKAARLSRQ